MAAARVSSSSERAIPVTFYVRRWIGARAWRLIHYLSFGLFGLALAHGVWSGSDSGAIWPQWTYAASGLSLIALTYYRVQVSRRPAKARGDTMTR